jgi:HSP20 family protein
MSLIKRDFPLMTNLSDLFEDDWFASRMKNDWLPAINIVNNEKDYELEVAAPGWQKEDIHVNVENHVLTISGQVENEAEENKKNYTRKEFSNRAFSKSFTLPEDVKEEAVKAKYDNGVLKLTLTKMKKELPPRKEVKIS